ncbi:hypothetical protein ACFQ48_01190 [Hymenobacter caeli]|uniref:Uncharacterized protein n=1 Tax=Hymenobacter caeli TaxID=2735894 RepID=A0ABX2FLR7_9BACT|nr:hypothetical protein [Hymenobacter caeli]NRT17435.1 hypothetical protein [Hymenobacter caeli]
MNKLMRLAKHRGKLLFLLLPLHPFLMQAQGPDTAARKDSAIKVSVVQNGRYSHLLYTVNNEPLTGATLKAVLKSYPKSAEELRKYRAQRRLAFGLLPVYVATLIVGGVQSDKQKDTPGSPFSKAPVPFSIALGAFFGSIVLFASDNHFAKAIEVYNGRFK